MGDYTNEKSLMVVQDNFLNKIKNFFSKAFFKIRGKGKYYEEYIEEEDIEENYNEKMEEQVGTQKQRRLFNYEEEVGDGMPENISEDCNTDENEENNGSVLNHQENENNEDYSSEPVVKSKVEEEKEELERKLMNYYASIKKGI